MTSVNTTVGDEPLPNWPPGLPRPPILNNPGPSVSRPKDAPRRKWAKSFWCWVCRALFQNQMEFKEHLRQEHGLDPSKISSYECTHCARRFRHASALKYHFHRHHAPREEFPFQCELCLYRFPSKAGLRQHQISIHSPLRSTNFLCTDCDSGFSARNHHTMHLWRVHNLSPGQEDDILWCLYCSWSFFIPQKYIDHVVNYHDDETPLFFCRRCDVTFGTPATFANHGCPPPVVVRPMFDDGVDRPNPPPETKMTKDSLRNNKKSLRFANSTSRAAAAPPKVPRTCHYEEYESETESDEDLIVTEDDGFGVVRKSVLKDSPLRRLATSTTRTGINLPTMVSTYEYDESDDEVSDEEMPRYGCRTIGAARKSQRTLLAPSADRVATSSLRPAPAIARGTDDGEESGDDMTPFTGAASKMTKISRTRFVEQTPKTDLEEPGPSASLKPEPQNTRVAKSPKPVSCASAKPRMVSLVRRSATKRPLKTRG